MEREYPKNLNELLKPIRWQLFLMVILSVMGAICLVVAPVAVTLGVGSIVAGNKGGFAMWILIAGVGIFLRQLLHMGSLGYAHIVEAKFRYNLRKEFSEKLSRLPLGWFANSSSGEIRKLVSDDTIKIHTIIAHAYSEASAAITLPLSCMAVMLYFEWKTGLMVIGAILLILVVGMFWMGKNSVDASSINSDYEKAQGDMSHAAVEMVDGIKEIKNFGMVQSIFGRFEDAVNRFSDTSYKWLGVAAKPMAFIAASIQPAVIAVITLFICLFSAKQGWLMPEEIILFLLLAMALPSSLMTLAQLSNFIREGNFSAEVLTSIYAKEDQLYKSNTEKFANGDIAFENVTFGYDRDNPVLKNICCKIPKGKVTALVGPSGGGKTTMARLIPRFWDVDLGKITIGGVDVKDMSAEDLLKAITLVFQDVSLMQASIAENIALSKPNATMEEIVAAARSACIHDRIMKLPGGYEAVVGQGGAMLSGGEKQRITIARSFLANAPIVILDEATAQADAESEVEIQKALTGLGQDKTVVIIAHRLQTIVEAEQILVVDNGEIVQQGTHKELVNQWGIYKNMWNAQNESGGEI